MIKKSLNGEELDALVELNPLKTEWFPYMDEERYKKVRNQRTASQPRPCRGVRHTRETGREKTMRKEPGHDTKEDKVRTATRGRRKRSHH